MKQIDIGLILPGRGKGGVDKEPVEFQQILCWHIVNDKRILLLPIPAKRDKGYERQKE
jgi:hypothetical protein